MREAKCAGDQKFSSYTGRCGPASNAPMPCGTFVPGNTGITCKCFIPSHHEPKLNNSSIFLVHGYGVMIIIAMSMIVLAHL